MSYVKHLVIGILALATLGAGINVAVDPFDIFGTPRIEGFNTHKSIGTERFSKPLQAVERRPKTIILGSSRCLHGIDPRDAPGQPAYNLSVAGALADELTAFARHAANATTAKTLILCLDFASFNDARTRRQGFYDDALGPHGWVKSLPQTVFSYAALKRSRDTLRRSLRGKRMVYRRDGFREFEPRAGRDEGRMITPVASFLSPGGGYRDFPGVDAKLAELAAVLKDIPDMDIQITALIPPVHAVQLEAIDEAGLWPIFEHWKRAIAEICDATQHMCWDFATYSPVSAVSIAATDSFGDSSHFTPRIGKMIFDRINDPATAVAPFGTLLKRNTIEDHLKAVREARDRYRRTYPEDVEAVRNIAITYRLRKPDGRSAN